MSATDATPSERLTASVRRVIGAELDALASSLAGGDGETIAADLVEGLALLTPGKMLRTRLAARLASAPRDDGDEFNRDGQDGQDVGRSPSCESCASLLASGSPLARYCAALEMAHTATLCHDDVIDSGLVRRAQPALWTRSGASAAVLIGDILLSRALALAVGTEGGRLVGAFVAKVQEVCNAEATQELLLRGKELDVDACVGLARGKTGPLFAFAALVAGRFSGSRTPTVRFVSAGPLEAGCPDEEFAAACEEAGYRLGTAYQVFDDLVDVAGVEEGQPGWAGKTLGTDVARRKFTIPQRAGDGRRVAAGHVRRLCIEAIECLRRWPRARAGVEAYVEHDLGPLFEPILNRAVESESESSVAPAVPSRGGMKQG